MDEIRKDTDTLSFHQWMLCGSQLVLVQMSPHMQSTITTPYFMFNSKYDQWQLANIFQSGWKTKAEQAGVLQYGKDFLAQWTPASTILMRPRRHVYSSHPVLFWFACIVVFLCLIFVPPRAQVTKSGRNGAMRPARVARPTHTFILSAVSSQY